MPTFSSFIYDNGGASIIGFDGNPNDGDTVVFIDSIPPEGFPATPVITINILRDLTVSRSGLVLDFTSINSLGVYFPISINPNPEFSPNTNLISAISSVNMSGTKNFDILSNAFNGCTNLQSVDMSNSTGLNIQIGALNRSQVRTIDMSSSIGLNINYGSFNRCSSLQSVNMSNSTGLTIDYEAFTECNNLQFVDMSNSTGLTIDYQAFTECTNLQSVDMSNSKSLHLLGEYIFNRCNNLTEIRFPSGLSFLNGKALSWFDYDTNQPINSPITYYLSSTNEDTLNISVTNLDSIENLPANLSNSSGVISGTISNFGSFPAENGHQQIVRFLLQNGANLRTADDWALRRVSEIGHLEAVKFLVQNGANAKASENYPVRLASCRGHLEVVKFLVQNGADVRAIDDYAVRWASQFGHLEVVKFLVQNGSDVRADNDYAVRWASGNGHLEVVKFLVENGADVRACNDCAIRLASRNGHLEIVKFLVQNGADIRTDNDYAVRWASKNLHFEVVKFLVDHGAQHAYFSQRMKKYLNFCEKRKIKAIHKIASWWIPICYRLRDENGELRMAVRAWKKLEKEF